MKEKLKETKKNERKMKETKKKLKKKFTKKSCLFTIITLPSQPFFLSLFLYHQKF
jgi:hypothetical protein